MRTGGRVARLVTVVAGSAAGLLLSVSVPVLAGSGDARGEAGGVIRGSRSGAGHAAERTAADTEYSAVCEKCHSTCENGMNHLGLPPLGETRGAGLPLDAAGRAICLTCHASGPHEAHVADGHLRVSNTRRELCLVCHRQETGAAPRIEIVSPLERAVIREERVSLIGRAIRVPEDDLTVRLNGSEFHLHVKGGEFSTWISLQDGVNRIEIAQGERLLWKGEVFHGEISVGSYERSSSGHQTGNRAQCQECHRKKEEMSAGDRGVAKALCYGCHDRNDEKRYVHGPLAVGDCLACHDPHGGYGTAHLRHEQTLLCGNCHAGSERTASIACNASGKGCVGCHDPHQSNTRFLLRGPQYTMRDNISEIR